MKSTKTYALLKTVMCLFIFYSCQREESSNVLEQNSNTLSIDIVNFERLNKDQQNFLTDFNKSQKSSNDNLNQRKADETILIDASSALHVITNELSTYTFSVIENNEGMIMRNVVIFEKNNGDSEYFLIKYTLDEPVNTLNEFNLQQHIINTESSIINPSSFVHENVESRKSSSSCWDISTTTGNFCEDDDGNTQADNGQLGNGCSQNWHTRTFTVIYIDLDCLDQGQLGNGGSGSGSDGGNTGGDGDTGNNGTGGGGSDGNENDGNTIVTPPNFPEWPLPASNVFFSYLDQGNFSRPQISWINSPDNEDLVAVLNSVIIQNGTFNQDFIDLTKDLVSFLMELDWKARLRNAIATGITSTAEVTHEIYSKLSDLAEEYPSSINYINVVVDEFREIAGEVFLTESQNLSWIDLFGIWLFELGEYPQDTINFEGSDVTTESLKQQEGVSLARQDAIDKINNNNISEPVNRGWTYGQGEFYDGMANGNIATSFLGSYNTRVDIVQNADGSHTFTFTVSNPSTWESATRLRIDNDGDNNHDGIFPNKNRGVGIHLGGNINQTWIWTELVD